MSEQQFKFPALYQFFAGYFYQGWAAGYRWDGAAPEFSAVVRHFRAVNPPAAVEEVRRELAALRAAALTESALDEILAALGSGFYPPAAGLTSREWLDRIVEILDESPTKARVLRELG
ncbi:MAG: hypothetical protein JSS81_18320 [Acidobacteria bacterium]|nr:hypothetical protein [Acidobacteriota bacterium]